MIFDEVEQLTETEESVFLTSNHDMHGGTDCGKGILGMNGSAARGRRSNMRKEEKRIFFNLQNGPLFLILPCFGFLSPEDTRGIRYN